MMFNYLHKDDFETKQANTANVETLIAEAVVPEKMAWYLTGEAMQLFLAVKETFSGNGVATQFTTTKGIIDSPSLGDDGGAVAGYVGGARAAISAVNYTTGVVTFASAPASGTNNVDVYYIIKAGNLKIRAAHPNKTSRFKQLFARSVQNIHSTDQYNNKSAPMIQNLFVLPEKYVLQILLNSSQAINWDNNNIVAQIAIPYTQLSMAELPADIKERVNRLLI
ncbi:MAG: hypothetical protein PHH85_03550 [Candidatus Methanoperedens sp.]|nr:hypothetical protein [Candidatus Methanoperedens sp.]